MPEIKKDPFNFPYILSQFAIEGTPSTVTPYGSGHIHDTFRVHNTNPHLPDYLLQRINHAVFKNIPELLKNVRLVTDHLRKKIDIIPGKLAKNDVLTLLSTHNNKEYFKDNHGNFWRLYNFIQNTHCYDFPANQKQALEGGKSLGVFHALLSDFDVEWLYETIPFFHDIQNRLKLFEKAIGTDKTDRAKLLTEQISFVRDRSVSMSTIIRAGKAGEIPLRTTHNDTKFNNILLNNNDEALCMIDLDTVMPGYIAYDFGDAIRTIISGGTEDESNLDNIRLNIELFSAFTTGFLNESGKFMSKKEIDSLIEGVLLPPYIMGVRFLTDYIDGDRYYKIDFPDQNLRRAKAQFRLVEELEKKREMLATIIRIKADESLLNTHAS